MYQLFKSDILDAGYSDETELAAIALEEEVTTTNSTEEEETNELMDCVFGDDRWKWPIRKSTVDSHVVPV